MVAQDEDHEERGEQTGGNYRHSDKARLVLGLCWKVVYNHGIDECEDRADHPEL